MVWALAFVAQNRVQHHQHRSGNGEPVGAHNHIRLLIPIPAPLEQVGDRSGLVGLAREQRTISGCAQPTGQLRRRCFQVDQRPQATKRIVLLVLLFLKIRASSRVMAVPPALSPAPETSSTVS